VVATDAGTSDDAMNSDTDAGGALDAAEEVPSGVRG
jgi:hypothetical protein